jgi:hypothetical protein
MFTKKIIIEVSAETSEALESKVQTLLADPAIKEAKQDFWVTQGSVDFLQDVVRKGHAENHLGMTAIFRDKPRPNSLPVFVGEFGVALGNTAQRQAVTPPTSFISVSADGSFAEWMRRIACSSTTPGERKTLVRCVRSLVTQCAFEQRRDADVLLREQLKAGLWTQPSEALPGPYEDVRILVDGLVRIARLGHDRKHFQFASYMGSAKYQYSVALAQVAGWQALVAIPATQAMKVAA